MNAEIAGLLSDNDNLGFNGLQVVVLVAVKQPLTLLLTAINLTTGSPQNSAGLQEQGQIIFIAKDRNCQQSKIEFSLNEFMELIKYILAVISNNFSV